MLESHCLQSGNYICNEALGKVGDDVHTCLTGLPMNLLWHSVHQELQWCLSNLSTAAHAPVKLNTITQKPSGSLPTSILKHSQLHYMAMDNTAFENTDLFAVTPPCGKY